MDGITVSAVLSNTHIRQRIVASEVLQMDPAMVTTSVTQHARTWLRDDLCTFEVTVLSNIVICVPSVLNKVHIVLVCQCGAACPCLTVQKLKKTTRQKCCFQLVVNMRYGEP